MSPKKDPKKAPVPAPPPSTFLGTIPKKKPASAAAAARAAGGPVPSRSRDSSVSSSRSTSESRGDKRQRNPSGATDLEAGPKKLRDTFDPQASAIPLGNQARNPPPSPTTSISTVQSEATEGGPVEDKEEGDELEAIKACMTSMGVQPPPAQVCRQFYFLLLLDV
jgi:hypothetical protein